MMLSPRKTAELGKSRNRIVALIAGLVLGFGISTIDASAQTYACPPGYYFLAGYGCYPFGGYANNPPPPSYYYYPAYPYAVPAPPPASITPPIPMARRRAVSSSNSAGATMTAAGTTATANPRHQIG